MKAQKKTLTRFRARIDVHEGGLDFRGELQRSRAAAIREAVDYILESGAIEVDEIPVEKRQKTEYVEVES